MDQEALSVASEPLSDERAQAPAPAGSPAPNQQAAAPATDAQASAAPDAASATATAPAADPNADPDAQPQEDKPKFKGGFQKRIDELTRRSYDAERRAQQLEQQLRQVQTSPPPQAQDKPAPKITDFQDIDSYNLAVATWAKDQAIEALRAESRQASQRTAQEQSQRQQQIAVQTAVETFNAREIDTAAKHADYYEVANSPLMVQIRDARPDIASAVIDSEHGPEMVYFLGKNPQAAQALARMHPIAAAREIGRIEQMFMQPKAQATNAPPPPRQVGGNASAERRPEDMSNEEYRKWRRSGNNRR